jgi:anaerobic ribonucleoside-triphosphate reductase activating protein
MIKYQTWAQTFSEVPDEISLYVPLANCTIHCEGCNSKWLWLDKGTELTEKEIQRLIDKNKGITCVCIGGGEGDFTSLNNIFRYIKEHNLKTCWYSGLDTIPKHIDIRNLDFIKIGHYNGTPINEEGTNQIFWKVEHYNHGFELINETQLFRKHIKNNSNEN